MAVAKFYNATVTVSGTGGPPPTGGTAIPHVRSVTISYNAAMLDITEMGNSTKVNLAGILEWSVQVNALADPAASGGLDVLMFPLVGAAAFYIQIKPDSGSVTTSNPEYYGYVVLSDYSPVSGNHGEAPEISMTFNCAGPLTRRTS